MNSQTDYQASLEAENRKWGGHRKVEADADLLGDNWLGHPLITEHYNVAMLVDGLAWPEWIRKRLGGPAERSLDLGCGVADRSLELYRAGASRCIEGIDISEERLAEAERRIREENIPGGVRAGDINTIQLPPNTYDLIFSYHSFHHFLNLEHIMEQVHQALTPRGLFVLEEFVGPTQFQWTELQVELVRAILRFLPEELRMYRMGWMKEFEGRPKPEEVAAVSPFESIRSADILPLFKRHFQVARVRQMGGTLQHLLYNGIVHNFIRDRAAAESYVKAIYKMEDLLMDFCLIPSDFMLLIGQRKDVPLIEPAQFVPETRHETIDFLKSELAAKQREIEKITNSLGGRLLGRYGKFKYRYLLPLLRMLGLKS